MPRGSRGSRGGPSAGRREVTPSLGSIVDMACFITSCMMPRDESKTVKRSHASSFPESRIPETRNMLTGSSDSWSWVMNASWTDSELDIGELKIWESLPIIG